MGLEATFVRRPGEKGYWDAVSRYERVKDSERKRDWPIVAEFGEVIGYMIAGGIIASMFWLVALFVWF